MILAYNASIPGKTGLCNTIMAQTVGGTLSYCSIASLVLAAVQLGTVIIIIAWLRRQAALAQLGDAVAGKRLIMPVYFSVLYGIAFVHNSYGAVPAPIAMPAPNALVFAATQASPHWSDSL